MSNNEHKDWFQKFLQTPDYEEFSSRPIAYFGAEYAFSDDVHTYAGGLGVLAGDVLREAVDQKIPMMAVGLWYRSGYICQSSKNIGDEQSLYCVTDQPEVFGLTPVLTPEGEILKISVPIHDEYIVVRAWEWKRGTVSLFLLDSHVEDNSESDRRITEKLYVDDKETRLKQQIILGIGGMRLLEALNIHPLVYHLNEGHSALLALELIHHEMKERKIGFDEAKQFARRRLVFTNHTLVAAGNEVCGADLVELLLEKYAQEIQVPTRSLVELGLVGESSEFSLTILSLRMSGIINAVSQLHAKRAKDIWPSHPMTGITNGVHIPTWDSIHMDVSQAGVFWREHHGQKKALFKQLALDKKQWKETDLLIVWARRFASYKRPLAILEDIDRFASIARSQERPVRIVFSGIAHPNDAEGRALLDKLQNFIANGYGDVVAYIPNYDMNIARLLVAGSDVWLNTPVVGFEACGTSGMKAALNGSLPFSTKDGWVDEAELFKVGWVMDSDNIRKSVLDVLENDIVPMYYDRDLNGVPVQWEDLMRNARSMVENQFSATQMLRKYIEMLYV